VPVAAPPTPPPPRPTTSAGALVPDFVVPPVAHLRVAPMGDFMAEASAGGSIFQNNNPAYTARNLVALSLFGMPDDAAPLIRMGGLQSGG